MDYELIDSGSGEKLERFGEYTIARPCSQAVWMKSILKMDEWNNADAHFSRKNGLQWQENRKIPNSWKVEICNLIMKLKTTNFGHLGIFPETIDLWKSIDNKIKNVKNQKSTFQFLNLFAYSGGATLAAAKAGAHCCHVDASKGMVEWAKENALLNKLNKHPIRWIVDDVNKFLKREIQRGRSYDGILLDPPSFGRGSHGELYKIDKAIIETLSLIRILIKSDFNFVYLTSHTPGYTPTVLANLLKQLNTDGAVESGEMFLRSSNYSTFNIPNGSWACVKKNC